MEYTRQIGRGQKAALSIFPMMIMGNNGIGRAKSAMLGNAYAYAQPTSDGLSIAAPQAV